MISGKWLQYLTHFALGMFCQREREREMKGVEGRRGFLSSGHSHGGSGGGSNELAGAEMK